MTKEIRNKMSVSKACDFCAEFNSNADIQKGRIIWRTKNFVFLPTIGCLTPGYCLLMPIKHYNSFAELPERELFESFALLEKARSQISEDFGTPIIAEHGSGGICDKGASCCSHAHMHLIPVKPEPVIDAYKKIGGDPFRISNIKELKEQEGSSYMFLSPSPNLYLVWYAAKFVSQFVRRVSSNVLGFEYLFNWKKYPFHENMIITKQKLAQNSN